MVITLKYTHDEENMSVWVQGDCIASCNHDSDGWGDEFSEESYHEVGKGIFLLS